MKTEESRVHRLNQIAPNEDGAYVLDWMEQSQRSACNHALEYAIHAANEAGTGLQVVFALHPDYSEANLRHYHFMLKGLQETAASLRDRGLHFTLLRANTANEALDLVIKAASDAVSVVTDLGYLRPQRAWRTQVADVLNCPLIAVEADNIVPLDLVSDVNYLGRFALTH